MIPTPSGWFRQTRADGVHLRAPRDRPIGEFRYREYYGPLRTARQVVAHKLASFVNDQIETLEIHPPEKLITDEGEYAALVPIDARVAGRRAKRAMGMVFGDRFTTLLDGMSIQPELFDEFISIARDLTQRTDLVLGVRRRRFVYEPPATWQSLATGFITHWIPPDYPRNNSRILVPPATPQVSDPADVLRHFFDELRGRGTEIHAVSTPGLVEASEELRGLLWRIEAYPKGEPPMLHHLVVIQDPQYIYPLRMDIVESEHSAGSLEVFQKLCTSLEPIPNPRTARSEARKDAFQFWAD